MKPHAPTPLTVANLPAFSVQHRCVQVSPSQRDSPQTQYRKSARAPLVAQAAMRRASWGSLMVWEELALWGKVC